MTTPDEVRVREAAERYRQCRFLPVIEKKAAIERVYATSIEPIQAYELDGRILADAYLQRIAADAEGERSGALPTQSQNPHGLHKRYRVTKADGSPCDPNAVYFVLRLDSGGDDHMHIEACREAAKAYCREVETTPHLHLIGKDLLQLLSALQPTKGTM